MKSNTLSPCSCVSNNIVRNPEFRIQILCVCVTHAENQSDGNKNLFYYIFSVCIWALLCSVLSATQYGDFGLNFSTCVYKYFCKLCARTDSVRQLFRLIYYVNNRCS